MTYKTDERDVEFNLFEWIDLEKILNYKAFGEHNPDLYKMILTEALKFSENELAPLNKIGDEVGCHKDGETVVTPPGFKECYQKFAANGFVALDIEPTHGGQGLPYTVSTVLAEYFGGANTPLSMYAGLSKGASHLIETFATERLADLFCEKIFTGKWAGTMCLTEPGAGSAVGDIKTTAKKNADGTFNITGSKLFITGGDHDLTENIIHLVLARVEGDPEGTKGISLFIVPKIWVNDDGSLADANDVACVNVEHKMGIKGSSTCTLAFGENNTCRGFLVGEQRVGMKYMFQMMNEARLLCGLQGESIASTAYLHARDYAKERVQGGGKNIIEYPDVRRNLSLCKSYVEGMRALLIYTAWHIDIAKHETDPAAQEKSQNRADLLTPICKAYCSDIGFRVTEIAMQVLGGYGYISEYPIEQYMRDVKISSIYEGTNGIQALDLLARKLALKNGELFREFYEELSDFCASHEENTDIKSECFELKKALDSAGQVAMQFAQWGMSGDRITPQLGATPFLEMCGHITCGYLLLSQANKAIQLREANPAHKDFYNNKVLTAKFFIHNVLPRVRMYSKAILTGDTSAMEIQF